MKKFILLCFSLFLIIGFFSDINNSLAASEPSHPIYKTRSDYFNLVPVSLSEDKTKVISYPWPGDIFYQGQLAYPKKLEGGYLMDNRGIWTDTAFLDISYEDYSQMRTPSPKDLLGMIKDKNPFVEFYDCGHKEVKDINKIISNNSLSKDCKVLIKDGVKLGISSGFGEDFSDDLTKSVVEDNTKTKNNIMYIIIAMLSFTFGAISVLIAKKKEGI